MTKGEVYYLIGGTIGMIVGFIAAKVYQIWAMLYAEIGVQLANDTGWEGTPIWQSVNANPGTTTFIVLLICTSIGLYFAYLLIKKEEPYINDNKEEFDGAE
ncbi:hypothetical protein P8610_04940 [Fictibacillus sp. UD]|uniref:hypothetical protein n=1 Tax=Fictibacillus sp. UD TaxID=3038777 RepID=UPI003744EC16